MCYKKANGLKTKTSVIEEGKVAAKFIANVSVAVENRAFIIYKLLWVDMVLFCLKIKDDH